MKTIGFWLISLGFLGGAYFSSLNTTEVNWLLYAVPILVGAVGIFLVRTAQHRIAHKEERVSQNISAIESSLRNIVKNVEALNTDKASINPYHMARKLDDLLIDDLNTFVEARETIAHIYGLKTYADVMAHFAGGERYLNRVWSASVDGYIDEVNTYLERSLEQFQQAQALVSEARQNTPIQ